MFSVVMMLKDEEKSVETSLSSVKNYVKDIVILDTGSQDNTINKIKTFCKNNKLNLFLKESVFKNFAESRNEAIEFAENNVNSTFLLLMDAGDEFKANSSRNTIDRYINMISKTVNYGLVRHSWLVNGQLEEHYDVRFIRTKNKCRYDERYPVHEKFKNVKDDILNVSTIFYLFQNRDKYGGSTSSRYLKDVEMLENSVKNRRNLYFLGQTYLNMENFEKSYEVNKLCYETLDEDDDALGDHIINNVLFRIGYSAMREGKPKELFLKYFKISFNRDTPPIESFIFFFLYCIENKIPQDALPYVEKLFYLEKPSPTSMNLVNHQFYDYKRWNLIGIICLLCKEKLDIGYTACKRALEYQKDPVDVNNLQVYKFVFKK